MSDSERSEELAKFLSAVGEVDQEIAIGYLESVGWDAGMALEAYYNDMDAKRAISGAPKKGQGVWPGLEPSTSNQVNPSKIRTLGEVMEGSRNQTQDGQDMFAGGEKSGTAIRFPGMPDNVSSMLNNLFSRANQPRPSTSEDESEEEVSHPSSAFPGLGRRPGATTNYEGPSIAPGTFPDPATQASNSARGQVVVRNLTLWRNGLTLEDGPLIPYDSPDGSRFMEAVSRGSAPLDLLNAAEGQKVDVHVRRKLEEEYKPTVSKNPFSGVGNRVGSIVPSLSNSSSSPQVSTPKVPEHTFDPNKPQTTLQIRLADGTKLVAKFNLDNTVADIRNFINSSMLNGHSVNYLLQTSFPVRVLDNPLATLKEEKLENTVIVQRRI